MFVERKKLQPMLDRHGCDPYIVSRNRTAFLSQEYVHLGVSQRRFLGYVQNANGRLGEESRQPLFVLPRAASRPESAVEFSQHHDRYGNGFGPLHYSKNFLVPSMKRRVRGGVEQ